MARRSVGDMKQAVEAFGGLMQTAIEEQRPLFRWDDKDVILDWRGQKLRSIKVTSIIQKRDERTGG